MPITLNDPEGWFLGVELFKTLYKTPLKDLKKELRNLVTDDVLLVINAVKASDEIQLVGKKAFVKFFATTWADTCDRNETKFASLNCNMDGKDCYNFALTLHQKYGKRTFMTTSEQHVEMVEVNNKLKIKSFVVVQLSKELLK